MDSHICFHFWICSVIIVGREEQQHPKERGGESSTTQQEGRESSTQEGNAPPHPRRLGTWDHPKHHRHKERGRDAAPPQKGEGLHIYISQTGINHEGREVVVDSGASMHKRSKSEPTLEEQDTSLKSKESCSSMTPNQSITTTEEATANVRVLDMFTTVQLLDTSRTLARNFANNICIPMNGKSAIANVDQTWQHKLQVGTCWTDVRICNCRRKSPRCRCNMGDRQIRQTERFCRLGSTIYGRIGRRRIWIIQQTWSSTHSSKTLEQIQRENTIYS